MDRDDRRSGEREEHAPHARQAASGARGTGPGGMSGLAFAGLGFQFAVSLVAFYYLGQWLDRRFGTAPVLVLVCVLGGAGAAFYAMYRQLMNAQRRDTAARAARRGAGPASERPESRP